MVSLTVQVYKKNLTLNNPNYDKSERRMNKKCKLFENAPSGVLNNHNHF